MIVRFSTLASFAFVLCVVLSGFKSFSAWPQVTELWEQGHSVFSLLGHPHVFRYAVAYPGLSLEEMYPGLGFSIYCSFFIFLNSFLWSDITRKAKLPTPSLVVWGVFFCAHFFMNGRGVIAWAAWLSCVSLCVEICRPLSIVRFPVARAVLACFLATVSTGVFVVVVFSIVFFVFGRWRAGEIDVKSVKVFLAFIVATPFAYVFICYFFEAIQKNLDFYGGGIQGVVAMLEHGLGGLLLFDGELVLLFAFLIVSFSLVAALICYVGLEVKPLRKLIAISMIGGFFGFTVLTLSIPLILYEMNFLVRRTLGRLAVHEGKVCGSK